MAKSFDKEKTDTKYVDLCSVSEDEYRRLATGSAEDRAKSHLPVSNATKEEILVKQKMSFLEEAACVLFMAFGVPNGIFTFPPLVFLIGKFIVGDVRLTVGVAAALLLPLAILPQKYKPSTLQSWLAFQ
eukprot:scaffold12195_cov126-Cylindrotheca_fusiformis.AAC.10